MTGRPHAEERGRIAAVVVTYNPGEDLDRCLAALAASPPSRALEIAVVDNASRDGSPDRARARWPEVRLLRNEANRGFAAAANQGIRATSSDFVLLLNPDVRIDGRALDRLAEELEGHPEAAAVGPLLRDPEGGPELSFGGSIGPFHQLGRSLLARWLRRGRGVRRRVAERLVSRPRSVAWLSGACLLLRRSDAVTAGLLDEGYFLYFEDADLCSALRDRGREVRFTPTAEAIHARGRAAAAVPELARQAYRRGQLRYYRKHRPRWLPFVRLYLRLRGELPAEDA